MTLAEIEKRDPGIVLVLAVFTCGLYLFYWYSKIYDELEALTGQTPTGKSYLVDLLLTIVTCSVYGIWVDYQISLALQKCAQEQNMPSVQDSSTLVVVLDLSAFVTGFVTNYISSAMHQDQLNKVVRHIHDSGDPYRSFPAATSKPF